jgi:hypothetical protein
MMAAINGNEKPMGPPRTAWFARADASEMLPKAYSHYDYHKKQSKE